MFLALSGDRSSAEPSQRPHPEGPLTTPCQDLGGGDTAGARMWGACEPQASQQGSRATLGLRSGSAELEGCLQGDQLGEDGDAKKALGRTKQNLRPGEGQTPDPADPTPPVQQRPEIGEESRERSRPTPGG